MNTADERQTAIHEAGHAVAHVRFGLDHDGAHIIPDGEGLLGGATGEGISNVWGKAGVENVVLASLAGCAALIAAGYTDIIAREGAGQDFEEAEYLINYWGLLDGTEAWLGKCVELMRKPENIAAVALIAEHLFQRKRLPADYIDVLVLRGAEVERAYRMADVYVLPSVSEPFGLTVLEAIQCGVPVILSKTSGVGEVVPTGVLRCDFWDTHDMAGKILAVLNQPELAERLRLTAYEEIRPLTWDAAARKCLDVYREALSR